VDGVRREERSVLAEHRKSVKGVDELAGSFTARRA
jgi:hypothetical protein